MIQVVLQQYSQIWTPCKTFHKYLSPKGAQYGSLSSNIFIGVAASVLCMNPYSISSASEARQQVLLGELEYLPQTRISTYYTHEPAREAGKEGGYMGGQQGVAAARRKEGRQIVVIAMMDETH